MYNLTIHVKYKDIEDEFTEKGITLRRVVDVSDSDGAGIADEMILEMAVAAALETFRAKMLGRWADIRVTGWGAVKSLDLALMGVG